MALDDPTSVTLAAAPTDRSENDMNEDWTGTYPTRYILRVIDIKEVTPPGGEPELQACFRAESPPAPLPAGGITEAIMNLFKPTVLAPDPLLVSRSTAAAAAAAGYPGSPLDLELLGAPTYVVYVLGRPANMYFRPGVKAVTHKNFQDKPCYGELKHIQASATAYSYSEIGFDGCTIISFIADPPEPPATPAGWGYRHDFNLHLRFTQPADSNGNPRVLDIDIDPDIRYPGQ